MPSTRNTSTPLAFKMPSATGDASGVVNTQVGVSRAVPTSEVASGMRSLASRMTRTGDHSIMPGSRQVRCGSSDSTVPMPTRMASDSARI